MPNHRVLLLNDDPDLARLLASYLESEACEVTIAADGLEGLERLDEVRPELVVSDVHMPRLDGFQFCRVLRSPSHRRWNEVPVILVSYTLREHSTLAISRFVGANDFLALPCGKEEFLLRARSFLHRRGEAVSRAIGTMLVAEPDERLAADIASALQRAGYDAAVASNAEEARTLAAALDPFVVIAAHDLPGEGGLSLLAGLRRERPEALGILLTDDGARELGVKAIVAGAADYLVKPLDTATLAETVEQVVRKSDFQRVAERFHRQILLLRQKNEELQEAHRLKNRFLSMATHDLVNPLNVIKNWAEAILEEGASLQDEHVRGLQIVARQAESTLLLIHDVLDLTRLEEGRDRLIRSQVDMAELLQHQVEAARILAQRKGIELRIELPPDLPGVRVDPRRMMEVFNNLIGNGIKFCSKGDEIVVSARLLEKALEVRVSDTGPGLAPEEALSVFQTFTTGKAKATGGEWGAGLGLAIVKGYVELHGGQVSARSREGGGTVFRVLLPRGEDPLPAGYEADAPAPAQLPPPSVLAARFLEGADARLRDLRTAVAALREGVDGASGEVLRLGHSLGGAAETYGIRELGQAGRAIESLMNRVHEGRHRPDADLARLLEESLRELEGLVRVLREGRQPNVRPMLDRLSRWSPSS